jgi:hypothetical protein
LFGCGCGDLLIRTGDSKDHEQRICNSEISPVPAVKPNLTLSGKCSLKS